MAASTDGTAMSAANVSVDPAPSLTRLGDPTGVSSPDSPAADTLREPPLRVAQKEMMSRPWRAMSMCSACSEGRVSHAACSAPGSVPCRHSDAPAAAHAMLRPSETRPPTSSPERTRAVDSDESVRSNPPVDGSSEAMAARRRKVTVLAADATHGRHSLPPGLPSGPGAARSCKRAFRPPEERKPREMTLCDEVEGSADSSSGMSVASRACRRYSRSMGLAADGTNMSATFSEVGEVSSARRAASVGRSCSRLHTLAVISSSPPSARANRPCMNAVSFAICMPGNASSSASWSSSRMRLGDAVVLPLTLEG
mmetsp:Transcript_34074/g.73485  ORF Transcript_34074/g.73485 Transcript_34074/m.73485 type:complete len:311 (-) Transcript_34074:299-1231(-)